MKSVIRFRAANPSDYTWFTKETSYYPGPQFGGIVAYDSSSGRIMAMVGLDSWTPRSVHAHMVVISPRAIVPLWQEVVDYLRSHGRRLIFGVTPSNNVRALRLIKRLGWEEKYRLKDAWDLGVDMVISEYVIHEQQQSAAA